MMTPASSGACGGSLLERLPMSMIDEIFRKLDVESLCSATCVCRTLHRSASPTLSSLSALDFSGFSPDKDILKGVLHENKVLKSLTLNCLRLDDSSINIFMGCSLQELVLLKCSLFSYKILTSIGQRCSNLRILVLEIIGQGFPEIYKNNLAQMLKGCLYLESLCLKIRGTELDADSFRGIELFLPKTVKILQLQPVLEQDVLQFLHETGVDGNLEEFSANVNFPFSHWPTGFRLQSLSLHVDIISDELLLSITNNLRLLVELNLEDKPSKEPSLHHDLTNTGLQSLCFCNVLTSLSLARSRQNSQTTFKRVNDVGIFLLVEGCRGLESVRLGGFSRVSDAGFASILHSCKSLKRFEVFNAFFLSDLAFHNLIGALCSLLEVRLVSCSLITSETVEKLSSCKSLEVLDLWGCKNIADHGLSSISSLSKLTKLNIGGADVTDGSLSILSRANLPIGSLCLRGCKRVTDKGVALLLHGRETISRTLASLDLGHMPGISDKAILTIAEAGLGITDLCIRYCFFVTDVSVKALASKGGFENESRPLRRLDLYNCTGLSINSLDLLKRPSFNGLRWLGIGNTCLSRRRNAAFTKTYRDRPWLTVCLGGCEMGCQDGWQFHGPEDQFLCADEQ